jgi:uncharacterized membrane protein YebE (DUF533 family)
MASFFPEIEIRPEQAEAIARGLYAVARADANVHEREAALINDFFASASEGFSPAKLGELERADPITGAMLASALPSAELRQLFMKTALLLAWSDNTLADGESRTIRDYAAALGIASGEVDQLEAQVKDFLISQLAHLSNVDAAAAVARKLDI